MGGEQSPPNMPMYRVTIDTNDFITAKDFDELQRCFGRKSEYEVQANGDVVIRHPLNPYRPLLAMWEEGQ